MSSSRVAATPAAVDDPAHRPSGDPARVEKRVAIFSGLLGLILFILVPFLPVTQTQSSVTWPQNDSLNSINAPLISVAPESYSSSIPLRATEMLREGQSLVLSTVPQSSPEATDRGLFVTYDPQVGLDVSVLSDVIFSLTPQQVADNLDANLEISISDKLAQASVSGTSLGDSNDEDDLRPQVTGVYTEIEDTPQNVAALRAAGLNVDIEINSRFTSSPTVLKLAAMISGTVLLLVALVMAYRIDRADGRGRVKDMSRWKQLTPLDGVVGAVLGFWHIFGANTSDDGFILTMARVADHSTYMANYYRWYGVPEAPFGTPYYELLGLMTQVSANSLWMRLPSLIAGVLIWLLISRELLPRFGPGIDSRRVAHWTAALVFLSFWLPYNNGIRPEPMVALGTLITWALFERSLATRRLLPAVLATFAATITLTVGPTGMMAVGVFLVFVTSILRMAWKNAQAAPGAPKQNMLATVSVFLVSGTFVMVPVFADQTLATVLESTRVRGLVGPALNWYDEYVRYSTLFSASPDGSLTRRFAMFTMLICLGLIAYSLIRFREIPGVTVGPTYRLMAIVGASMFFLMFTPTKWSHHFGIYAGLAGVAAALGAVVLSQIAVRSSRARTFSLAGVVFLLAITFAGWNGWWYISSFGVPWWDKTPQFKEVEFNSILLVIALIIFGIGIVQSLRHQRLYAKAQEEGTVAEFEARDHAGASAWRRWMTAPIAVVSALIVAFSGATFVKAFASQYPAYSVGLGNVNALTGNTNYLGNEVLIETNTAQSFLEPVGDTALAESLSEGDSFGFDPNWVPEDIDSESQTAANVGAIANQTSSGNSQANAGIDAPAQTTDADDSDTDSWSPDKAITQTSTTGGFRSTEGVNGSYAMLPFNLDPDVVPILGSYVPNPTTPASTTTTWYHLPERSDSTPLLVVSAAGKLEYYDRDGILEEGQKLKLQYGRMGDDGRVEELGETLMYDIGPSPSWRNLRFPLDELPEEANVVRLVARDTSLDPEQWLAFTPPRVPELEKLSDYLGDDVPGLLDWSVSLQFPQQRSFDHFAGITEIPEYRISPDHAAKDILSGFQDFQGGGALATAEAVNTEYQLPTYTKDDWKRDWGSMYHYQLRRDSQGNAPTEAEVNYEKITRSGLWYPSKMNIREP